MGSIRPGLAGPSRGSRAAARRERARGGQRAQALVEFAILVSVLALVLVGVVDLARVFFFDVVVSSAANEGVRAAASGSSDASIDTVVRSSAGVLGPSLTFTGASDVQPVEGTRDDALVTPRWVTVRVAYTFTPITPIVGGLLGSTITISRQVSQQQRTPCCY